MILLTACSAQYYVTAQQSDASYLQFIGYFVQFTILPIPTKHHAYMTTLQSSTTVDDNRKHTVKCAKQIM